MDRAVLEGSLAAAEHQIVEAERQLANERERMAQLERDGHDTTQLTHLLAGWEEVLAAHIADRDRLRKELGA